MTRESVRRCQEIYVTTRAHLTPRTGIRLEEVERVVREVRTDLGNLHAKAAGGNTISDVYLTWADDSVRMMRHAVSPEDVDRLVLTRRYWAITAMAPPVPARTVHTEIDDRVGDLDDVLAHLEATHHKWSRTPGQLMVADTTLFCQHEHKIRDIDFAAILECREAPVRLMLPILVLDELDGLKRSGRAHTRWRAAHTLGVLDEILDPSGTGMLKEQDFSALNFGGIPRGRVDVEVYFDPPAHRRLPINDDELIDRAQVIAAESGRLVTFVTFDTGQSSRARFMGLEVKKLREDPGPEPD